jgi:site-specific DNA-methyltransferase (adenine-specific)
MHGDCRDLLRTLPDASIDSIVTDPPYELGFMGKSWDSTGIAYQVDVWRECLRVLKHGGHLLAFGGSRTYHRLACAIEDAGFQIRDQIMWVYGSGFPKSLNVSKSIEGLITTGSANKTAFKHLAGEQVERGNWGIAKQQFTHGQRDKNYDETASATVLGRLEPITDEAKQWEGWGTALKPAHEPIVLARKPLDGTVAQNVLWYGTGALNIDECRVGAELIQTNRYNTHGDMTLFRQSQAGNDYVSNIHAGRFPANFIHDGSDEVLELFPDTKHDDGSAARFFYCAKASKTDRNEGLAHFPLRTGGEMTDRIDGSAGLQSPRAGAGRTSGGNNHHPTVKPTTLMRYLIRLVTPPDGTVLDPFTGSGSTGKAAILEGFRFVGIEQDADYVRIADARIKYAEQHHEG